MGDREPKKQFQWHEIVSEKEMRGVPPSVDQGGRRKRPQGRVTIPVGRCGTRSIKVGDDGMIPVGKEESMGNAKVGGGGSAGNRGPVEQKIDPRIGVPFYGKRVLLRCVAGGGTEP